MKLHTLTILSALLAALHPLAALNAEELDPLLMEALENDAPIATPPPRTSRPRQSSETAKHRGGDSIQPNSIASSEEAKTNKDTSEKNKKTSFVDSPKVPIRSRPVKSPSPVIPEESSSREQMTLKNGQSIWKWLRDSSSTNGMYRVGAWGGFATGSQTESGYSLHIESDIPLLDYPFLISIRGEFQQADLKGKQEQGKEVYGSYGYSYYDFNNEFNDLSETQYGISAVLLWKADISEQIHLNCGAGGIYLATKTEGHGTQTKTDHHSFGYHRGNYYTHSSYRSGKTVSTAITENDSESSLAPVLRAGLDWDIEQWKCQMEVSLLPNLYEDSSETEFRASFSRFLGDTYLLDFIFEYRTEAKSLTSGIGMSVWY